MGIRRATMTISIAPPSRAAGPVLVVAPLCPTVTATPCNVTTCSTIHSNLQQKAELDELRRKYREQTVALRGEREAIAKSEAQKRTVTKQRDAAREALKAILEQEQGEDDDEGDDDSVDRDGEEGGEEDERDGKEDVGQ